MPTLPTAITDRIPPPADLVDAALEVTIAGSWSTLGFQARRRLLDWDDDPPRRLDDRVVVLTGFTSGLGRAAAERLGSLGAQLHLVSRTPEKVEAVAAELRLGGADVSTGVADMADFDDVRRLADDIRDRYDRVHVLAHNAGALSPTFRLAPSGTEVTVTAQVLGPFLLTSLLLPVLEAAGPGARVLTMSSGGMYAERLDVDALEPPYGEKYSGTAAYARAKRAQVELTAEWARRGPADVAFHALHPGWADTPGVVSGLPTFHRLARPILRTPAQGADTLVWLASVPSARLGESGGFWLDRRRRSTVKVPWTRTPDGERERLWNWCVDRTRDIG